MGGINYLDRGRLNGRMIRKVCADKLAIPRPVILGVSSRMDADESPTLPDKTLKPRLLFRIQNVAGSMQKNHHPIAGQIFVGEYRCVFTGIHRKMLWCAQSLDGSNTRRNRLVAKAGSFSKDQRGKLRRTTGYLSRSTLAACTRQGH